jgi:DNA ligase D-like protein (predicted ligase)
MPTQPTNAAFVEPMLLLSTSQLPEGPGWTYELKLDGYRALAMKVNGKVQVRSRNDNDFNPRYPDIVKALAGLPDETVVDGEIVAIDESGRPSFNALQNHPSSGAFIFYYVFDVLVLSGRSVISEKLSKRRDLLQRHVLPGLKDPIREYPELNASLSDVIRAVRTQGLEGVVAKDLNSSYEPGRRSGAWRKMRISQRKEFVIGGYTVGPKSFDAVIFGYYENAKLLYAGRTRNGFTPLLREQVHRRFRGLEISKCPFSNLPEARAGRWGLGLTAEKMKDCRWVKPELVGEFEYVEWTPDNHLRHSRFVTLRKEAHARTVQAKT